MLSPPDARLVGNDPALPGLALVLDPDAFAEAVQRSQPDHRVGPARASYVRYKQGTSCLVTSTLEVDGEAVSVHAIAYPHAGRDKLAGRLERPAAAGPFERGRFELDRCAVLVSVFPNDVGIPALDKVWNAPGREALLQRLVPDTPELWASGLEPLRYKPERRFVAATVQQRPWGVLKLYSQERFELALRASRAFPSGLSVRLPRLLGFSRRHRAQLLEWVAGEPLDQLLGTVGTDQLAAVGAALAELHSVRDVRLPATEAGFTASIARLAVDMEIVAPELSPRIGHAAANLCERLGRVNDWRVPIHGDLDPSQLVVTPQGIAVIDLDSAALGHPLVDLGSLTATLLWGASDGQALAASILEAYADRGGRVERRHLDTFVAAGLFRLLPEPFRHREAAWLERTEALLELISARLDRPHETPSSLPAGEAQIPQLTKALDRGAMQGLLQKLPAFADSRVVVASARLARHRTGRRCLVEYELDISREGTSQHLGAFGKIRAWGTDRFTWELNRTLWTGDFGAGSDDGISVPEPIGVLPELRMWLQARVDGVPLESLLSQPASRRLGQAVAGAIFKLHTCGPPPRRRHSVDDELAALTSRLGVVANERPVIAARIARLLDGCVQLRAELSARPLCPVHRDFYHDHLVVADGRLFLLDLDLYSEGDPALDLGNFIAHLEELSLRTTGRLDSYREVTAGLVERYLELAGARHRAAIQAYTTLSLARHVQISHALEGRRHLTETLLDACGHRLLGRAA